MLRIDYCLFFFAGVSLSDWLALAGKNLGGGGESPRLLRDRPTDGAALAHKFYAAIWRGHCGGNFIYGWRVLHADCGGVWTTIGATKNAQRHAAAGCEMWEWSSTVARAIKNADI